MMRSGSWMIEKTEIRKKATCLLLYFLLYFLGAHVLVLFPPDEARVEILQVA